MSATEIAFAGSIPENYDRGLGPVMFEPYAVEVASRLRDIRKGAVLEVACGTGRVTRQLRKQLPGEVRLVATDLSEGMVAFAQSHSPGQIEWRTADAQELPFGDAEFDAVVCQFGMMFLPDRAQGVREFRRVLKPGGRVLAFVWDRLDRFPVLEVNHRLLMETFPDDPPRFLEVPCSMSDAEETHDLFATSFSNVLVERVEKTVPISDPRDLAEGCVLGNPVANQIAERDPTAPAKLIEILTQTYAEMGVAKMSALLVTASG